jgi:uncharacterized protein YhbP (UPF0306 family)
VIQLAARERALDYPATHRVMTLATHGPGGPWAAAVFYANDGFALYFLSSPLSRHGRNLAAQAEVAATVQEDYADWREIKGIQLEGTVRELSGAEEISARKLYGQKFPVVAKTASAPVAIDAALARVRWYRLAATRAYFVDNSASFARFCSCWNPASASSSVGLGITAHSLTENVTH